MKKYILIIHGGNAFEKYEDYISELKSREVTLKKLAFNDWKRRLSIALGEDYEVILPQMPNAQNARYAEWKIWFEKILPLVEDDVVLVGHSLGGIFLAKYLSENDCPKKIRATFLVAAPFNTKNEHSLVDFVLLNDLSKFEKQGGVIWIYHSTDDSVVPYSNAESYMKALPLAHLRGFEDRGHFNFESFPEIVEDIQGLER